MLCFDCIDGFRDIEIAFQDCVELSIAEQMSKKDCCLEPANKRARPAECEMEPIEIVDDIIDGLDLSQLGDFEEYLMLPSLELLMSPPIPEKINYETTRSQNESTPQSEKAFKCKQCAKKFAKNHLLKKHLESKHQKPHEKRQLRPRTPPKGGKDKPSSKKQKSKPVVHEGN